MDVSNSERARHRSPVPGARRSSFSTCWGVVLCADLTRELTPEPSIWSHVHRSNSAPRKPQEHGLWNAEMPHSDGRQFIATGGSPMRVIGAGFGRTGTLSLK